MMKLFSKQRSFRPQYAADGLAVKKKNISFLSDPEFDSAWVEVKRFNEPFWAGDVPDIRWRAHVCVWAARRALQLNGNFVELGVNTGLLSSMICRCTKFSEQERRFFLFDTYAGIPGAGISEHESAEIVRRNKEIYRQDVFAVATAAFADFPNAVLIKGALPNSLEAIDTGSIAYLSIDLNSVSPEIASAEILWSRIVSGGIIVLDDYAFEGHDEQYEGWNTFARQKNVSILTLPTGQGLIIRD